MTQPDLFDICAQRHQGNANSVSANERKRQSKASDRAAILALLRRSPGLTCDAVEAQLGMSHQTCSARFSEMKRAGTIKPAGSAPTRSGCRATTWEAATPF